MTENVVDEAPQWELSKENVQPIKRGRRVKGLKAQEKSPHTLECEEKLLKNSLDEVEPSADKLALWLDYLSWARTSFPSSSTKTLEVLEACTNDLKGCKELRNDPHFVKLWIEYADLVQTPGEVFSFMQANKIGIRVALFWIAWAFVAEKLKNFGLTDKIFQKGIKMQAEPKDVMAKRYQQFQRRLARHYINMAEEEGQSPLTSDSGRSDERRQRSDPSTSSSRKALSQVGGSKEQHTTSRSNSQRSSKDNFTVFQENAETLVGGKKNVLQVGEAAENVSWKSLGDVKQRTKENVGLKSKWTEAPLEPSRETQNTSSARGPRMEIFVDPAFNIKPTPGRL
jgi:mitotic checkpoint serine/threonine-protein kinase BUB1 beta